MKANITAEIQTITPEIAVEWLQDKFGEQRGIRNAHVERLASDMRAGKFKISPDAILRVKGKLANGQHRLSAVAKSGVSQKFIVMESNDDELYKVIDSGLRRTASDGLMGIKWASHMPSIARWVRGYENQTVFQSAKCAAQASAGGGPTASYASQTEVIDYCLANRDALTEAASFVHQSYEKTKLLPMSIGGAVYAIGVMRGHESKAKEFIRLVYLDGGNNAAGDLRNRLIANKCQKAKLSSGYIFGITIKAFKSFINGSRPAVLKWAKDEQLPEI